MAEMFTLPARATDANGDPYTGALANFYATGTTTPQSVYTTSALSVAHQNPVVADAGGKFAPIYLDPDLTYRAVVTNSTGSVTLHDIDPLGVGDTALRADLAAGSGSSLVTFTQGGSGAVTQSLQTWLRRTLFVTPQDFGAVADGVTNDYPAFQAAAAYLTTRFLGALDATGTSVAYAGTLPTLFVPQGRYKLNSTWEIKAGSMHVLCEQGALLQFAAGINGVIIQAINTTGSTTGSSTTGAGGTILENLSVRGSGGGAGSGIWMRAGATLINATARNFAEHGIAVTGTAGGGGAAEGNSNNWRIERALVTSNGKHGLFVDGDDANSGTAIAVDAQTNARFGIFDSSFLGNTYIGCHTDSNGLVGHGYSGQTVVPTIVSNSGNRYAVRFGEETGASANAPSGTTAHNTWWAYVGAGGATAEIPAYAGATTYTSGGSYVSDNVNARCVFIGCYEESGQAPHQILYPSITVGGLLTGLATKTNERVGASTDNFLRGLIVGTNGLVVGSVAVASLPAAASSTGMRLTVTDSNAALTAGIGAVVAGGGANVVPVFCDGTNWRIG